MITLTNEQIGSIGRILDKSITTRALRDDLLDHLCCTVEAKMAGGADFTVALHESITELAPNGLGAIQLRASFLVNSTKIIYMKKLIYFFGLLSAMAFGGGTILTVLHFEGGMQLQVCGIMLFGFIVLPLIVFDRLRAGTTTLAKMQLAVGTLCGILGSLFAVVKIMHLEGSYALLLLIGMIFVFGFLPVLFLSMYRKAVA